MAAGPPIVAELGRAETPEETAERKATSSRTYRSSQTTRNLVAALLVTLAMVAVVVFIVPRGSMSAPPSIDVATVARQVTSGYDHTAVVPHVPSSWRVNAASVSGDSIASWTIVYVPDESSYLRVSQGFDADGGWATRLLGGASPDGHLTVGGIEWTTYAIADPAAAGNVSYAIGTAAGRDQILVYGTSSAKTAATAAAGMTDQIRALRAHDR